jgi:D-xylono/L-arabinono-1,4-lactonase
MLSTHLEIVADFACSCGEGPLWHPDEKKLYWTDVDDGVMFSYDPAKDEADEVYKGPVVGGMTLNGDGRLLLFMQGGAIALWSPGKAPETVIEGIPEEKDSRFNDVIADPQGRVFCGTMPSGDRPGRLYRLDPDGKLEKLLDAAGQPNGMAFSPDGQYFYITDTQARTIDRYNYDAQTGSISERENLITVPMNEGVPDGLTVDAHGFLWSARWDGACIVRYDAAGNEMNRIMFPVQNVTSLTFVEETVYVTTAGGKHRPEAGEKAGALFRFHGPVSGIAEFRSRLRL